MTKPANEHKIPPYQIRRMTSADEGFYEVVGPFLSKREIVNELGSPVWDDPAKRWYIAVADGAAIGMVALWRSTVCSFWVEPRSRGMTVGYALLRQVMGDLPSDVTVRATATGEAVRLFQSVGFEVVTDKGRFTAMRRCARD